MPAVGSTVISTNYPTVIRKRELRSIPKASPYELDILHHAAQVGIKRCTMACPTEQPPKSYEGAKKAKLSDHDLWT